MSTDETLPPATPPSPQHALRIGGPNNVLQIAPYVEGVPLESLLWRDANDEELAGVDHALWGDGEQVLGGPGIFGSGEETFDGPSPIGRMVERIDHEWFDTLILGVEPNRQFSSRWRAFQAADVGESFKTNLHVPGMLASGQVMVVYAWRIVFAGDLTASERKDMIAGIQAALVFGEKTQGHFQLSVDRDLADVVELRADACPERPVNVSSSTSILVEAAHELIPLFADSPKREPGVPMPDEEMKKIIAAVSSITAKIDEHNQDRTSHGLQLPARQNFMLDVSFSQKALALLPKLHLFKAVLECRLTRDVQ